MNAGPYGSGETALVYQAVKTLSEFCEAYGIEATIRRGHIDIITMDGAGIAKAWINAMSPAPVRRDVGPYPSHTGFSIENLLKANTVTIHLRPAVGGA